MDEKGDEAIGMDDEPENGEQAELGDAEVSDFRSSEDVEKLASAAESVAERMSGMKGERKLADGARGRISIREKLAEMSARAGKEKSGGKQPKVGETGRNRKEAVL